MTIREDSLKIAEILDEIGSLFPHPARFSKEEEDRINQEGGYSDRHSELFKENQVILSSLQERLRQELISFKLSDSKTSAFFTAVNDDVNSTSRHRISISVLEILPWNGSGDWFSREVSMEGDALEENVSYFVFHPELFAKARSHFDGFPIEFQAIGENYWEKRLQLLSEHGLPVDLSAWEWAADALIVAEKGLAEIGIGFRLCDYVDWTCTGDPPQLFVEDKCGPAKLSFEAPFGARLVAENDLERCHECIWIDSPHNFVSPLWEHLTWGADTYGKHNYIAELLGQIGRGIHMAMASRDPSYDLQDEHRARLLAHYIFEAGSATVRLRIKLELEEHINKGRRAEETEKKRARLGGERSAATRQARIVSLLGQMEELVANNPALRRFGAIEVARLACEDAKAQKPDLWSQGAGQFEEYVGEMRRGESGPELRMRFSALFPEKPLKR